MNLVYGVVEEHIHAFGLTNWTQSNANEPCMCYDEHKSYQGSFQQGKEQTP
ncbi:hypothetical protein [Coprococcus phoceensis]|uniref:hypothetical protein n=1 Tax=Coprococcus phoceensis TaxID=1870993 RepID=UPI00135636D3|nr:hypothetical protein [Coprococcus phoceensis]